MSAECKRKTLVNIELSIWATVKHFATIKGLSLNEAVQLLLRFGLRHCGYNTAQDQIMVRSGESFPASKQQASLEVQ